MFSTVPGLIRPLASSAASEQSADAKEPTVDCVAAALKSYFADNASHAFDYLGGQ